jgi:ParB/RepB/Spo0J family partition protein
LLCDPDQLVIDEGWNIRKTENLDIDELADSIKEIGQLVPILVRAVGNKLHVVAGHRRVLACRKLNKEAREKGEDSTYNVKAILEKQRMTDWELVVHMLKENDGKKLEPDEEAEGYRRLEASGKSQADIARLVGKTPAHINQRLMLLHAGPELIEAMHKKEATPAEVVEIVRKARSDLEQQRERLNRVRELRMRHARTRGRRPKAQVFDLPPIDKEDEQEFMHLAHKLGTAVMVELLRRLVKEEGYSRVESDLNHALNLLRMEAVAS